MNLYERISRDNRTKYGTEAEKVLGIIINQYSDRTHFIYEILQNAEDAGAEYISFHLEKDCLMIFHNGRPFNEKDIEGVCGIANGTKEDGTRIGHFGIGFKSVYCYTETPFIYSGHYHFQIKDRLFPKEVDGKKGLSFDETCMILPFNKMEVSSEVAYQEIRDALVRKINAESILMLNKIDDVKITIVGYPETIHINKSKYAIDRFYPDNVFSLSLNTTVTNVKLGKENRIDVDYLFFTDANEEATAIIFKVDDKELKPVNNSKIYAFFPTAKEAHQNFYIHAPFDTTPARDNFKKGAEYGKHNIQLVKNIGELISFAFRWMKDHKYLSVSGFNTVFPIYEYEEDDILYGIYKNSIDIIQEEIILPTNTPYEFKRIHEIYVPLGGVIVDTFNDSDLQNLTGNRKVSWLAKEFSTEAYADIRRFLNRNFSLQTLEWKDLVNKIDATFLEQKPVAWVAGLMSKIESYCIKRSKNDGHYIDATKIPFVRVASGKHICARDEFGHLQVYLNNPDIAKYRIDYQFVRNVDIWSFYQRALLIPEYNIEQETIENILPKYETQNVKFKTSNPIKENIEDLKTIKDAVYTNRSILDKLADKYIVTDGKNWYCPRELYIDSSDVRSGYSLVRDFVSFKFLASSYFDDTVLSIKLDEDFFRKIGCNSGIRVLETSKNDYLNAVRKYQGKQKEDKLRFGIFNKTYISSKINWAFCYEGFEEIFKNMTKERSLAIAKFLNPNAMEFDIQGDIIGAEDQHYSGKHVESVRIYSMLGLMLSHEKWIYVDGKDTPYSPLEIGRRDLSPEYKAAKRLMATLPFKEVKDALDAWLEGELQNKEDIEQIKQIFSSPQDMLNYAKVLAKSMAQEEARKNKAKTAKELIEKSDKSQQEPLYSIDSFEVVSISEKGKAKREANLEKEFAASLDNFTGIKRGLRLINGKSNKEEREFLEQEYSGHCQICLKRIIKHNGENYFEAINIIKFSELSEKLMNSSKYGWNSLCLCPNCAAEYNYASKKISTIYDQIMSMDVIPGSDDTIDIQIEMPEGKARKIHYSPRHFMALKEALKIFEEIK